MDPIDIGRARRQPLPPPPLVCTGCLGAGKVSSACATCGGHGSVFPEGFQNFFLCRDCGNARCLRCGGAGRESTHG